MGFDQCHLFEGLQIENTNVSVAIANGQGESVGIDLHASTTVHRALRRLTVAQFGRIFIQVDDLHQLATEEIRHGRRSTVRIGFTMVQRPETNGVVRGTSDARQMSKNRRGDIRSIECLEKKETCR